MDLGRGDLADVADSSNISPNDDVAVDTKTSSDLSQDVDAHRDTDAEDVCTWTLDDDAPNLNSDEPNEISGIAKSRTYDDIIWAHNDSGEATVRFFSISRDAQTINTFTVDGAANIDWEDMVIGPGPAGDLLYFADVGDNAARAGGAGRDNVQVYVVPEPDPTTSRTVTAAAVYTFTYPDRAYDCESFFIDPSNDDFYFITKDNDGESQLFAARAPHTETSRVLEKVADVVFGTATVMGTKTNTGAQLFWDGSGLLVRTYASTLLWLRQDGQSFQDVFDTTPIALPIAFEIQAEAVTVSGDGRELWTISEGRRPALHHFTCQSN